MPPTSKKLKGLPAYWFGYVLPVSRVLELLTLSTRSGTLRARILNVGMWFVDEN